VRNLERGNAARKELERVKTSTSTQIDVKMLDYANFESVRTFAKELEGQKVDIAILNAGKLAEDGEIRLFCYFVD
jgi:short-subunit dehydrogenase